MHRETLTADELKLLTSSPARQSLNPTKLATSVTTGNSKQEETSLQAELTALNDLHCEFACQLRDSFAELIRAVPTVRLRDGSMKTYGQFVFGQPVPTVCAVVRAEPIDVEMYVALRPGLFFAMLDRFMGCQQTEPTAERPLSEIEQAVAKVMFNHLLAGYGEAWQKALSLQLTVTRLEHNLQRTRCITGATPMFWARYDVHVASEFGMLDICLPWEATQQIRERLAANCSP